MKLQGIPYFPYPSANDDKLRFLEAKFRLKGTAIYLRLLQKIYSQNGYYYAISDKTISLLKMELNLSATDCIISEIIDFCLQEEIWSQEMYDKYNILTSEEIQKEYLNAVRKRKNIQLNQDYLLGFALQFCKSAEETQKTAEETQKTAEELNKEKKTKQNKKDSKLINNIYNNLNACTGARVRERKDFERQPIIDYFSSFFGLYRGKYYDAGLEIVDCILEALDVAHYSSNGLVFKGKRYNSEEFVSIIAKITNEEFGRIVNQLVFNGVIESRHWYILGCLIKACNTPSEREDYEQEQFVNDMINLNESEV